jgi:hypothetical protein
MGESETLTVKQGSRHMRPWETCMQHSRLLCYGSRAASFWVVKNHGSPSQHGGTVHKKVKKIRLLQDYDNLVSIAVSHVIESWCRWLVVNLR